MRTTLELPDPLFARLKARAAHEHVTLKQLLRSYVEQGLSTTSPAAATPRTAESLPQLKSSLTIPSHNLSNASLFEMLDA